MARSAITPLTTEVASSIGGSGLLPLQAKRRVLARAIVRQIAIRSSSCRSALRLLRPPRWRALRRRCLHALSEIGKIGQSLATHLCQPLLQRIVGHGFPPTKSGARIGPSCRLDDVGPDASLVGCKESLPVRTSARERSRVDAWRGRFCAGCPRGIEAPVWGMAAKPISARRCLGSAGMMRTRLCPLMDLSYKEKLMR